MEIADLVRRARGTTGLTQQRLAARLGTIQSAVSRWEHGHDEPRIATLADIMTACELRLGLVVEPADVDRAQIRQQLAMTAAQRLESVTNVSRTLASARRIG